IVLKLADGIFKHELLGQHARRKAQVLPRAPCVEALQGLLDLAHGGTGRHWLTPVRQDVLEDAANQFDACAAASSGMTGLATFSPHLVALLISPRPEDAAASVLITLPEPTGEETFRQLVPQAGPDLFLVDGDVEFGQCGHALVNSRLNVLA